MRHCAATHLIADASAALAGSEGALGSQVASTEDEDRASAVLQTELASRLKKTRSKLGEDHANQFLLDALNTAVRHAGRSLAATPARARAFIKAVNQEYQDPEQGGPVTIASGVNITPDQLAVIQNALEALTTADARHQGAMGSRVHLTQDKEQKGRALDRWLGKWQQIAKADFRADQLKTFGIPANVRASRSHKHKAAPAPQTPSDPTKTQGALK